MDRLLPKRRGRCFTVRRRLCRSRVYGAVSANSCGDLVFAYKSEAVGWVRVLVDMVILRLANPCCRDGESVVAFDVEQS